MRFIVRLFFAFAAIILVVSCQRGSLNTESPGISSLGENREASNKIVFWGHSAGVIIEPFLEEELKKEIKGNFSFEKCSVKREAMLQVAARQGAFPAYFYRKNCVKMGNKYWIANADNPLLSSFDGTYAQFSICNGVNPCIINNTLGKLSREEESVFFEPYDSNHFSLESINTIETAASSKFRNPLFSFFWCDQEKDRSDISALLKKYKLMAEFSGNSRYLIIGSITGDASYHHDVESILSESFGQHYLNAREYLVTEAEKIIESFSDNDKELIGKGCVPTVWMQDEVHLNEIGAGMIAKKATSIICNVFSLSQVISH